MIVTFQGEEYDLMFDEQAVKLILAFEKCDQTILVDSQQILPIYTMSDLTEQYNSGYSQARYDESLKNDKEN